jgi:hypothetical protein
MTWSVCLACLRSLLSCLLVKISKKSSLSPVLKKISPSLFVYRLRALCAKQFCWVSCSWAPCLELLSSMFYFLISKVFEANLELLDILIWIFKLRSLDGSQYWLLDLKNSGILWCRVMKPHAYKFMGCALKHAYEAWAWRPFVIS